MAGRWYYPRRTPQELFGVMKLFDMGGKVIDATPYFGRGDVKFGRARKSFLLASAALVTPRQFIPIDLGWHWDMVPESAQFKISNMRIVD